MSRAFLLNTQHHVFRSSRYFESSPVLLIRRAKSKSKSRYEYIHLAEAPPSSFLHGRLRQYVMSAPSFSSPIAAPMVTLSKEMRMLIQLPLIPSLFKRLELPIRVTLRPKAGQSGVYQCQSHPPRYSTKHLEESAKRLAELSCEHIRAEQLTHDALIIQVPKRRLRDVQL